MNLNATAIGADRFRLVLSAAPGAFEFALKLRDNSFFQNEANANFQGNGPGSYELLFSAFPGVQFDKIGGIEILVLTGQSEGSINGPGTYRFEHLEIAAVPEPHLWQLATAAVLSLAAGIRLARKTWQ